MNRIFSIEHELAVQERAQFRQNCPLHMLAAVPDFDFVFDETVAPAPDGGIVFERIRRDEEGNMVPFRELKASVAHTLRFLPLCAAVEYRYGLPRYALSALIMQYSTGLEMIVVSTNEDRVGICGLTQARAQEFGLAVLGADETHTDHHTHSELSYMIRRHATSPEGLARVSAVDERLHALKAIDAVGRMLALWSADAGIERRYPHLHPFERALVAYSGAQNYQQFVERMRKNRAILADDGYRALLSEVFAQAHKRVNETSLIQWLENQQEYYVQAYALAEYETLPYLRTKATDAVVSYT